MVTSTTCTNSLCKVETCFMSYQSGVLKQDNLLGLMSDTTTTATTGDKQGPINRSWATVDMYAVQGKNPKDPTSYTATYRDTRLRVDHTWHPVYGLERQLVQDRIITDILEGKKPSTEVSPKAIFIGGPIGSGKTHLLKMLYRFGLFPLDRFVHIDSDLIKTMLPESEMFNREDRTTAATRLHMESVHVADLVQMEAIRRGLDIVVDSTLRDTDFFKQLFGMMSGLLYHITVVQIAIDLKTVINRCRKRALDTGRIVPHDLIIKVWKDTQDCLGGLIGYSDEYFLVDTRGEVPIFHDGVMKFLNLYSDSYNIKSATEIDSGYWPSVIP